MNYRILITTITALFLCLSGLVSAQTITQEEFLGQLQKEHPLFEKEKLAIQIQKQERNSYLGAKDWRVLSSVDFSREEPALAFSGPEKTTMITTEGGVEKLLWKTGGTLSATYTTGWAKLKIDPLYDIPESFFQNKLALTYTQPLLQNRRGVLNRLKYDLKEFDIDFLEIRVAETMEDFLAYNAGRFLDWVFLLEQEKILKERLLLNKKEYKRTKRKRAANLVNKVDVIRSEDAVRITKQNLVLAQAQYKALQAELAELSRNKELYNTQPEFSLFEEVTLNPLEKTVSTIKENSRVIKTLRIRIEQLEKASTGHKETLKPDLSLYVQANTKNMDENLGESFKMSKTDALVGMQFSVPIGKSRAKSQIKKSEYQIMQLEKQVDEVTLSLTSSITNLYIKITEMQNILALNQEQITSAKKKTRQELVLYNQGRGELTFVIQSQDNEENAKLQYAQNGLAYHKMVIQYRALLDQMYTQTNGEI